MRKIKYTAFSLIAVIAVAGVIELLSYAFFTLRNDRITFADPNEFTLTDREIATVTEMFDRQLGWDTKHATPFGERPRSIVYAKDLLMTFGDSFTYCDEVADNETWQTYLAQQMHENVYNFGTGAYGTDQALLKFREDHTRVKTKIVSLGLITENINRLVNIYRKFYLPFTGIPATKPRFVLKGDKLVLRPNPLQRVEDLQRLKDEKFIDQLGKEDFWYNQSGRPHFSFPYSAILFNKSVWREILQGYPDDSLDDYDDMAVHDPWEHPEMQKLLFAVIDAFMSEAAKDGSLPVVLIFPLKDELIYTIETGNEPPAIKIISNYCQWKRYNYYCPIHALTNEVSTSAALDPLFTENGHYSVSGNKLLAKHFYRYITKLQRHAPSL